MVTLDQSELLRFQHQLWRVGDIEFDEKFFAVPVDGLSAEEESLGDLPGSIGLCEKHEDFALTVGDRRRFGRGGRGLCVRCAMGMALPAAEDDGTCQGGQDQDERDDAPSELLLLL